MKAALIYRLVVDLILMAGLAVMPVLRGEEAFFGVRVGREFYEGPGRKILRAYRLGLAATLIISEALVLALSQLVEREPLSHAAMFFVMMVAATALYIYSYRRVRPFELRGENQRFALSLKPRSLKESRGILLNLILIIILAIPFILLYFFYPSMPERIPVHWNLRGEVDGWARKSISSVLVLPVMSVYLQGLFLLLTRGLLEVKITLPAEHAEQYLRYKEETLKLTVSLMDWMSLLCALLLTALSTTMILAGSGHERFLRTYVFKATLIIAFLMVLCAAHFLYRISEVNKKTKKATGRVYVQRETDAARWYGGGLIYFNPEDPAVFVEKMVGLGYTINLGNRRALLYLVYMIGLFMFTAWALSSL
ncbi:MAG TPA: DUF1648 domain-containing protein [Blastocatellia bacterium]|jgi:uncharacterized membrane protein|nr:DUF1648 domain-containing protein [Blastocatellia bacterium]